MALSERQRIGLFLLGAVVAGAFVGESAREKPMPPMFEPPPAYMPEPAEPREQLTLDACAEPATALPQVHRTARVTVYLPAEFEQLEGPRPGDMRADGYPRYEWRAPDNSTLSLEPLANQLHAGWTGLMKSECERSLLNLDVHIDVADASVYHTDFVLHAAYLNDYRDYRLLGHARSQARLEQMLAVARSVRIHRP